VSQNVAPGAALHHVVPDGDFFHKVVAIGVAECVAGTVAATTLARGEALMPAKGNHKCALDGITCCGVGDHALKRAGLGLSANGDQPDGNDHGREDQWPAS